MRAIYTLAVVAALALAGCATDEDCPERIDVTLYARPHHWDTSTPMPEIALMTVSLTEAIPAQHFTHITRRLDPVKGATFTLPVGRYFQVGTTRVVQGDTSNVYLEMGIEDGRPYSAVFREAYYKVGCSGTHFVASDYSH